METVDKLISIAQYLGLDNIENELNLIRQRSSQENVSLVLPLVGEFSSGKTTLINALTDSKKLETATKPTTATIYEVHFGCNTCRATVLTADNKIVEVNDIAELKNDALADATVVTVFDTSQRVPSSTIIVDTPGLSSPDPKHKQTLVNFLPKADGILLVTDINQQVTRSLADFIETMKLSMRPIYMVLTKSDTKSAQEIEAAKNYISENCKIPVKQLAVVSAQANNLDEFYSLVDDIQKSKNDIIKQVDAQRIKNIVKTLTDHIEELMKASSSDKELDNAIRLAELELTKITRNIDRLIESVNDDIDDYSRTISRKFEDTVSSNLNALVAGKSVNFDEEAKSMINSTATLMMNEYKSGVQDLLRGKAKSKKGSDEEVYLSSLDSVDMSGLQMSGLSYNLDLNNMGHEYDGWIKTGLIAVAAVGAVAAVASTGGAAAGTAMAAVSDIDTAVDIIDTATDVGSMVSNRNTASRIERAVGFATEASKKYSTISNGSEQIGQQMGNKKGMVDSIVGLVTDNMMSKPQRVRAVRNYVDSSLAPDFKNGLKDISQRLISDIRNALQSGASQIIEQKTSSLNQLKTEMKEKKDLFEERMNKLREFQTTLLTL